MTTIGLIHPGAMGAAVGAALRAGGHEVLWASHGRSDATRRRAEQTGLREVPTLAALIGAAEAIVSVVPPHAAADVAEQVAAGGFAGLYLDANAIAPDRSRAIAARLAPMGASYVDGGIVGRPPERPGTTWLHLSGPAAAQAAELFRGGPLETNVLGSEVGAASALKAAFAAWTKGSTALQAVMLAYAEASGVRDALEAQWERYQPGFLPEVEQRARRVTAKAWRFEGEMHEIADAIAALGVPDGFHRTAAEVYRRLAPFSGGEEPELALLVEALRGRERDGGGAEGA